MDKQPFLGFKSILTHVHKSGVISESQIVKIIMRSTWVYKQKVNVLHNSDFTPQTTFQIERGSTASSRPSSLVPRLLPAFQCCTQKIRGDWGRGYRPSSDIVKSRPKSTTLESASCSPHIIVRLLCGFLSTPKVSVGLASASLPPVHRSLSLKTHETPQSLSIAASTR